MHSIRPAPRSDNLAWGDSERNTAPEEVPALFAEEEFEKKQNAALPDNICQAAEKDLQEDMKKTVLVDSLPEVVRGT